MKMFNFINLVLFLVFSISVSCSESQDTYDEAKSKTNINPLSPEIIKKHVKKPKFSADIDGDGTTETIYLVNTQYFISLEKERLPRYYPNMLYAGMESESPQNKKNSDVGFLIHWPTQPKKPYQLIFDFDEYPMINTETAIAEMFVLTREKFTKDIDPVLQAKAKGDVFVIPTAAGIDSYFFFDREIFSWFVIPEMP